MDDYTYEREKLKRSLLTVLDAIAVEEETGPEYPAPGKNATKVDLQVILLAVSLGVRGKAIMGAIKADTDEDDA